MGMLPPIALLFLIWNASFTIAVTVIMYNDAQFEPSNTTDFLINFNAILSVDACVCECYYNSLCLTANYFGGNQSCTLYSAQLNDGWLRVIPSDMNAIVFSFQNATASVTLLVTTATAITSTTDTITTSTSTTTATTTTSTSTTTATTTISTSTMTTTISTSTTTATTTISTSTMTTTITTSTSTTTATITTSTSTTTATITTSTSTTAATITTSTSTTTATITTSTSTTTTTTTATTTTSCTGTGVGILLSTIGSNPWTFFSKNFTATNAIHTLQFAFRNTPAQQFTYLDGVSVADASTPATELLTNPSFELSTSGPIGWSTWCTSSCSGNGDGGNITTSGCQVNSGYNCYVGHCQNSYDFLGQSFSTIVGHTYKISFWYQTGGGSSRLYADIL